ncbi:sugar ABC transporter ATP-binding protein [Labrys sp. ZIDIC5]|uniref:sugar ABC transporter ATP-binding protein n=1 Tax=Labrys sedimenti TaxID=3106036 RepID=UPI002ACADE84|nr:sugar ABC transporter ATP-binding protein [Labrys sp. ZIDIC5]MDZ5452187.1 sugar ABC transporter ATP-binding protein [Labrys sp. ZIDIC5]
MADIVLSLKDVTKSFGAVKALGGISFSVRRGEIHTLLGENGAGKSTTLKIIKGDVTPTTGAVVIDGETVTEFLPSNAARHGIAMVHQELAVFENMTVAENVFVDSPPLRGGLVDVTAMNRRTAELLAMFELDIDPRTRVLELTPSQRQIIEILRAVNVERKIVILDEPTSGLNAHDSDILLNLLARLRAQGQTILFVSHRLGDVMRISDRITVLRDGAVVETLDNQGLQESDLVSRMVGRKLAQVHHRDRPARASEEPVVFKVEGAKRQDGFEDVSLSLRRGEIVGVYGLEGSGTAELSRSLFGLDPLEGGQMEISGRAVASPEPRRMMAAGVSYLNANRKDAGLFMQRSVADNVSAPVLRRFSRLGFLNERSLAARAGEAIKRFAIRVAGTNVPPRELSGGNQQKVMLSACLSCDPTVMIVNEPTRGIDVGAKVDVYRALTDLADEGRSLLVFSSELPEILLLADRILVMRARKVAGWLTGAAMTQEQVMALAAGNK